MRGYHWLTNKPIAALFTGRKAAERDPSYVAAPPPRPTALRDPAVRSASLYWHAEEDSLLKSLQLNYATNWDLIADVFNQRTARPSSDHRLPWDLYDRWNRTTGPGSKTVLPDGTEISIPIPEYVPYVDTNAREPQYSNLDRTKKQLRHLTTFEAIRKVQKKRENTPKPRSSFSSS